MYPWRLTARPIMKDLVQPYSLCRSFRISASSQERYLAARLPTLALGFGPGMVYLVGRFIHAVEKDTKQLIRAIALHSARVRRIRGSQGFGSPNFENRASISFLSSPS